MRRVSSIRCWYSGLLVFLVGQAVLTGVAPAAENPLSRLFTNTDTGDLKLKAEAGDAAAQEAYAGRLEAGHYYAEAARWSRKAAEAGRAESQYRLGALLLKGRTKMDAERPALAAQPLAAIHWLTQAARQDYALAQLALGNSYQEGVGVAKNPVEAYKWFLLAAENMIPARSARDRAALMLSSEQVQKAKQQAMAFRAGDRSDPRIKIVTQADLRAPSNDGAGTTTEHADEAAATEVASGRSTAPAVLPSPEGTAVAAEAPAVTTTSGTLVARSDNPLGGVYKLIFWLLAICGLAAVGLIVSVVIVAEVRQRRQVTPISAPAGHQPPTAPARTRPAAAPPRLPTAIERLRALDRFQFEKLIELVFTREGHGVTRRGGAPADGGIDLELSRGATRTAVQCRHWKHQQVGIKEVRDFRGEMTAQGFEQGKLVTISNYTVAALEFARRNQIEIVDGAHVLALVDRHQVRDDPEFAAAMSGADQRCPKCENKLVPRPAQRGANAGGSFWGCSMFPQCQFVMEG